LGNNLPNTKVLLYKMGMASREMIEKMSDIVWAIHPKNDEFEKVLDRIRFFAAELLSTKNIVFEFNVEDNIKELKLEMELRKNIYLICKEALNNAYKYSEASIIRVNFKKVYNKLLVEIIDNGIGFESNKLPSQGNGLFNMKARAIEINAILKIESIAHKGTIILLKIQL
jgi:two-component system sensor histidine kinase UhpB